MSKSLVGMPSSQSRTQPPTRQACCSSAVSARIRASASGRNASMKSGLTEQSLDRLFHDVDEGLHNGGGLAQPHHAKVHRLEVGQRQDTDLGMALGLGD